MKNNDCKQLIIVIKKESVIDEEMAESLTVQESSLHNRYCGHIRLNTFYVSSNLIGI